MRFTLVELYNEMIYSRVTKPISRSHLVKTCLLCYRTAIKSDTTEFILLFLGTLPDFTMKTAKHQLQTCLSFICIIISRSVSTDIMTVIICKSNYIIIGRLFDDNTFLYSLHVQHGKLKITNLMGLIVTQFLTWINNVYTYLSICVFLRMSV